MRIILLVGAAALTLSQAATSQESVSRPATSPIFAALSESGNFSSQIVGLDVYNDDRQYVGQIEDIATTRNGQTQAFVLSVGGMLGMGEHYIAVLPSAVKISYSASDKAWHASMNVTRDQLKEAPEFKYSCNIASKACINILN